MAAPIGISTAEVAEFCVEWILGNNPKHGMNAAAAEYFGVSRPAIAYHVRMAKLWPPKKISLILERLDSYISGASSRDLPLERRRARYHLRRRHRPNISEGTSV